jgi:hypothetical protein
MASGGVREIHGTPGAAGTTGAAYGNPQSTNAGPHSSNIANKLDPRVDSDRDNRGAHNTAAGYGAATGGTGLSSTTGTTGVGHGPHTSATGNVLDPRVDSSTGAHNIQTTTGPAGGAYGTTGTHTHGTTGTGFQGGISSSNNAGPHDSNVANKLDPRVDSDLDGRGNRHGATHGLTGASGSHATPGSGTAQNTAGPHNSDLANKLDPRIDSDLDGSNTLGGNRTRA